MRLSNKNVVFSSRGPYTTERGEVALAAGARTSRAGKIP